MGSSFWMPFGVVWYCKYMDETNPGSFLVTHFGSRFRKDFAKILAGTRNFFWILSPKFEFAEGLRSMHSSEGILRDPSGHAISKRTVGFKTLKPLLPMFSDTLLGSRSHLGCQVQCEVPGPVYSATSSMLRTIFSALNANFNARNAKFSAHDASFSTPRTKSNLY